MNRFNEVVNQRSYSAIVSNSGEAEQNSYSSRTCGPFQHLMISSVNAHPSALLFEIDVEQRLSEENAEENNFISVLRRALNEFSAGKSMALGGIFRVEKGTVNAHVMPDFLDEDLTKKEQVDQWLKFYEMHAPLNCFSVLLTDDINKSGFRLEHSHFFSEHGEAGHYHFDTTPQDVHYRGYFLVCHEAILIDPVF